MYTANILLHAAVLADGLMKCIIWYLCCQFSNNIFLSLSGFKKIIVNINNYVIYSWFINFNTWHHIIPTDMMPCDKQFFFQIKKFEKLETDDERITAGRKIYDQYIMKELLSQAHVSIVQ